MPSNRVQENLYILKLVHFHLKDFVALHVTIPAEKEIFTEIIFKLQSLCGFENYFLRIKEQNLTWSHVVKPFPQQKKLNKFKS